MTLSLITVTVILCIIALGVVTRRQYVEPQIATRDPEATESYFDAEAVESSTDGLGVEVIVASGALH